MDDGYTGCNFNRPLFQHMIADIEAEKIGYVITKDLSRLGRNYIEAGSYLMDASQTEKERQRLKARNQEIDGMFLSLYTDKVKDTLTE